jgi:hypothetical protein
MLRGIAACADLGARADTLLADLRAAAFAFALGILDPIWRNALTALRCNVNSLPLFHRVEHPPYFHH